MTPPVKQLLQWYKTHGRAFPWRTTTKPYHIWVSEVILQQTQTSRGVLYYKNFLKRFPTLKSLSNARWSSLLPVWRGLGYYSRARNMLDTAKLLQQKHHGRFPKTHEALLALPGIGPYTASAILSFAFNQPYPAIDTNLSRVFSRYFGVSRKEVTPHAEELFRKYPKHSATLNHALMDLGAIICKSKKPLCVDCPIKKNCAYSLSANPKPPTVRQTKSTTNSSLPRIDIGIACIHKDNTYLVGKQKKNRGGLWEFPGGKKEPGESIRDCIRREVREEIGVEVSVRPAFHVTEVNTPTHTLRLHFCRCQILRGIPKKKVHTSLKWILRSKLPLYTFPEANRTAIELLLAMK